MVAPDPCSLQAIEVVKQLGYKFVYVDRLDSPKRQLTIKTFLFIRGMDQVALFEMEKERYERVVLIDSEMLFLKDIDEFMKKDHI